MRNLSYLKTRGQKVRAVILGGALLLGTFAVLNLGVPAFLETLLLFVLFAIPTLRFVKSINDEMQQGAQEQLEALTNELKLKNIDLSKGTIFERINFVVEKIRDRNLKELNYRESLFDQMELGIITFTEGMIIKRASVKSISPLKEDGALGKSVLDVLFAASELSSEQLRGVEFHFSSVLGMKEIQWKLSRANFPEEIVIKDGVKRKNIKIYYVPIFEGDSIKEISMALQDVTEHKKFKSEAARREQEIEKIFALLQVSDSLFELFMDETRTLFDELKGDLKKIRAASSDEVGDIANRMFRAVHTIKANSKLFKLNSIQDVAHEVEQYLSDLKSGKIPYDSKAFLELTKKIMSISEEIYSYASLRKEILSSVDNKRDQNLKYRVQWIRSLLNQFAYILRDPQFEPRHLRTIQKEFGRALATFDRLSIRDYVKGYDSMIIDIAGQLDKKVNGLETHLEYHYFEPNILARVNDILVHCIRNSIDHGIEEPSIRLEQGKPEFGTIKLSVVEHEGVVTICLEDDGHGIEIPLVKQKALSKNLIPADRLEEMSDSEVLELIFHPGFSTTDQVSTISGRGLGMEAVRDTVHKINGQLKIDTVDNKGTSITIKIPSETEELLTPFMIYDLNTSLDSILKEYNLVTSEKISFRKTGEESILFGDRWSNADQVRTVVNELLSQTSQKCDFEVSLETLKGRRKVDSHWFYRVTFKLLPKENSLENVEFEMNDRLKLVQGNLKRLSGSLIKRNRNTLEMNLPSNIPVPFSSFEFVILLVCDEPERMVDPISGFFKSVMGGWSYDIITCRPGEDLPEKLLGQPCIVVMDDHHAKEYAEMRQESERDRDGVLLLTDEDTDVEILDELHIMPQNIIFAPREFEAKTLDRALASIILRRFLKDMIRKGSVDGQVGIQRVVGFPR